MAIPPTYQQSVQVRSPDDLRLKQTKKAELNDPLPVELKPQVSN